MGIGLNLTRNGLIVLISVIFVAGAGTAYAGMTLPMITLAGDVTVNGEMNAQENINMADGKQLFWGEDARIRGFIPDGILFLQSGFRTILLSDDSISLSAGTVPPFASIFLDGASSNVGIGTIEPSSPLHVVGDFTLESQILCTDCICFNFVRL